MALINYMVPVEFDFGAIKTLPRECAALGMSRVLLVTDNGLRQAGLVDRILDVRQPSPAVQCQIDAAAVDHLDRHQARDMLLLAACYDQSTGETFKAAGIGCGGGSNFKRGGRNGRWCWGARRQSHWSSFSSCCWYRGGQISCRGGSIQFCWSQDGRRGSLRHGRISG